MTGPLAPLSIGLVVIGVSVAAFASDDPFVIAACLLTSALLLARSPGPRRLFATIAITTGLAVAILNPLVSTQGDLILINGPTSVFLDLQVTLEELLYGLAAGARLAAVTMLTGAFLALVDRDRLAARAALVAPRSALTVALAARLLPALRRDAVTLHEAARLRGWRTAGPPREALRTWGGLLEPMCAAALERGGDHAEAMAARGYGAGRATAMPERALTRRERALTVVGAGTVAVGIWTILGAGDFRWYPTLGTSSTAALVAAALLAVLGVAAAVLVGEAAMIASAEGVSYRYPDAATDVLDGVGLELRRGEVVLLAGPSGGGKTTLLRAFAGLVPHFHGGRFAGHVHVDGLDTRTATPAAVARLAGIAFQDPEAQVVYRAVLRDVAFGLSNHGVPAAELEPRSRQALDRVGALGLADRTVDTLSGGELQRVALAGVLAPEPPVLLLDEPTAQLDDEGAASFMALIRALADAGTAVLIAEHRRDRADVIADRVVEVGGDAAEELPPHAPGPAGDVVLAARGLDGGRGGARVLHGIDLDVRAGAVVALHGANGTGKTTLLRLLAGLDQPRAGTVELRGRDVTAWPAEERYPALALVPQDPGRFLLCDNVRAEVASGAPHGAVDEVLAALGVAALQDRHPRDLSAGERERVAIAAALAADPAVLLLDEPTRGMDPARRAALARLIRARAATGRAIVVATHDRRFAAACGAEVHELAGGRLGGDA